MRKNLLALSIAAMVGGLSGVANAQAVGTDTTGAGGRLIGNSPAALAAMPAGAVSIPGSGTGALAIPLAAAELTPATTGVGHVLFVPYFTTQGSHSTLLNLVNTDTVNGKAVKLRFRGASNSDDLFDISIFLSPGDVWAASVSASGELSALTTNDTSCTLPSAAQIKETLGKFSTNRVMGNAAAETREGYVEILNMADIPPAGRDTLYSAIKHVNGVVPCTQALMDQQATPLSLTDPANFPAARGYSWPTGGLMANWTVVDVASKASFSGEAVALNAVTAGGSPRGAANLVFSPQTGDVVSNVASLTADPLLKTSLVRAASYDFPDLSTPYTAIAAGSPEKQANDLALALATTSISNEYVTDPSVSFATDWVFSMPTRRYAVAMNYANNSIVGHGALVGNVAAADVSRFFSAAVGGNVSLNREKNRICVDSGSLQAFDREENSRTSFVISPSDTLKFCGETSVLSFNGKPSVLGAKLSATNIDTKFVDGWLRIGTPGTNVVDGISRGLPVVGYAVGKAIGPDGGNFGGTWMHRTSR